MSGTARIEYWPHNGSSPHVIVVSDKDGSRLCFAYGSREFAEDRIDDIAFTWGAQWGDELQVLRP